MAALELCIGSPVPVKQLRENLRFDLALLQLLITALVFGVVFRVRINGRQKDDVLPVRRPDAAIGAGGNVRHLPRLPVEPAAFRSKIAYPDLRWIGRLRGPDQPFAVRGKTWPLFVIRSLIQA